MCTAMKEESTKEAPEEKDGDKGADGDSDEAKTVKNGKDKKKQRKELPSHHCSACGV